MSPRRPEENQRVREERKERILQAAVGVFARYGYTATRIADIAEKAGMSHGLVYHYFRSKEEIYAALADRAAEGASSLRQVLGHPGEPREKLRAMLETMLSHIQAMSDYYVLVVQAMTTRDVAPAVVQRLQGGREGQEAMVQVIAAGQAAGQFRQGDPGQLFMLLYAVIQGLAINRAMGGQTQQWPVAVDAETVMRLIEP